MKFREITACSKLQSPKLKYGYQVKKRSSISKNHLACSKLTFFHYIMNPDMLRNQAYL